MFSEANGSAGDNEDKPGQMFARLLQPSQRSLQIMTRAALRAQREVLSGMLEVVDASLKDIEATTPKHESIKVR